MFFLIVIVVVIFTVSLIVLDESNTKLLKLLGILGIILSIGLLVNIPLGVYERPLAKNHQLVASIDEYKIFYDESSNKYFRLRSNDWNLKNLYYIEYLNTEDIEEVIEAYKIIDNWE